MGGSDDAAAQQLQRVGSLRGGGNFRIVEGGLVWGDREGEIKGFHDSVSIPP